MAVSGVRSTLVKVVTLLMAGLLPGAMGEVGTWGNSGESCPHECIKEECPSNSSTNAAETCSANLHKHVAVNHGCVTLKQKNLATEVNAASLMATWYKIQPSATRCSSFERLIGFIVSYLQVMSIPLKSPLYPCPSSNLFAHNPVNKASTLLRLLLPLLQTNPFQCCKIHWASRWRSCTTRLPSSVASVWQAATNSLHLWLSEENDTQTECYKCPLRTYDFI